MSNQSQEQRGCLAFLFGFGGSRASAIIGVDDPSAGEEGNYHSGPGGYEGMGYVDGGYAADYRSEHAMFDENEGQEGEA